MPFQSTHVIVQKVDGVQIDNFWDYAGIELLPGTHTIEASYFDATSESVSNLSVTFEANAGRRYEVRGISLPTDEIFALRGQWTAWIVDMESGGIVGGTPPPE
jgi:hypothetical protein